MGNTSHKRLHAARTLDFKNSTFINNQKNNTNVKKLL